MTRLFEIICSIMRLLHNLAYEGTAPDVHCSIFATEQGNSLEFPGLWGFHTSVFLRFWWLCTRFRRLRGLSLHPESEDKVPVRTLWVLVDWARVVILLLSLKLSWLFDRIRVPVLHNHGWLCSHMDDWEHWEHLLSSLVFKVSAWCWLVPRSTFKEKPMDQDTLRLLRQLLLNTSIFIHNHVLWDISFRFNLIKRPFVRGVLTSDFLEYGSEETLWIVESCHPVRNWAVRLSSPLVQLVVPVEQSLHPSTEWWRQPWDFDTCCIKLPLSGYSEIVDLHNWVDNCLRHDDVAENGIDNFVARTSDDRQNQLELLNLLPQERVQRNVHLWVEALRDLDPRNCFLVFELDEIRW